MLKGLMIEGGRRPSCAVRELQRRMRLVACSIAAEICYC